MQISTLPEIAWRVSDAPVGYLEAVAEMERLVAAIAAGAITLVEFFEGAVVGTNRLGQAASRPFSLVWSNVPVGNYTLTAVATDQYSVQNTSAPVRIAVIHVQSMTAYGRPVSTSLSTSRPEMYGRPRDWFSG